MSLKSRRSSILLFSISILVAISGLYLLFDQFLEATAKEVVKAWYYGEIVNLQEGQILPAISKNQNIFEKSPLIKAIKLIDPLDPTRALFSLGEFSSQIDIKNLQSAQDFETKRIGFLKQQISVKLPGHLNLFIVYEIGSELLSWAYFLSISVSILSLIYLIIAQRRILEKESQQREFIVNEIRGRFAHDLKSPLHGLSALSLRIKPLDLAVHQQVESLLARIRAILDSTQKLQNEVLKTTDAMTGAIDTEKTIVPLAALLKEVVLEKKPDFASNQDLILELELPEEEIYAEINPLEMKRHLFNILQNSFEAIQNQGNIKVELSKTSTDAVITIDDNGCGIPSAFLKRVGEKGFSQGKKNGSGFGLYYAKKAIELWRGTFAIESHQGSGTTILIKLPQKTQPEWHTKLPMPNDKVHIVVIDDDLNIHRAWKKHFSNFKNQMIFFESATDFENWFQEKGQYADQVLFLFDFHLGATLTGLDLILKYGIEKESILVTSAYLEAEVIAKVNKSNIKVIPKINLIYTSSENGTANLA